MKTKKAHICYLLIQLILPVCFLIGESLDLKLVLHFPWILFLLLSVICGYLTVCVWKEEPSRLAWLALPLSVMNCLFTVVFLRQTASIPYVLTLLAASVCIFLRCPRGIFGWIMKGISLLVLSLLLLVLPIFLFGASMNYTRTVIEAASPDGRYTARVEESDQGALGGDTLVYLRDESRTVELLIGQLIYERVLYQGDWYEWQDMTLSWQDCVTLRINGLPQHISPEQFEILSSTSDELLLTLPHGTVESYVDTHGGFQGDGIIFAKIRFTMSQISPDQLTFSDGWNPAPIPEELMAALNSGLFRDEKGNSLVPESNMDWYFFRDEHPQATNPYDTSQLNFRFSRNFTAAFYDEDANILYYFVMDT